MAVFRSSSTPYTSATNARRAQVEAYDAALATPDQYPTPMRTSWPAYIRPGFNYQQVQQAWFYAVDQTNANILLPINPVLPQQASYIRTNFGYQQVQQSWFGQVNETQSNPVPTDQYPTNYALTQLPVYTRPPFNYQSVQQAWFTSVIETQPNGVPPDAFPLARTLQTAGYGRVVFKYNTVTQLWQQTKNAILSYTVPTPTAGGPVPRLSSLAAILRPRFAYELYQRPRTRLPINLFTPPIVIVHEADDPTTFDKYLIRSHNPVLLIELLKHREVQQVASIEAADRLMTGTISQDSTRQVRWSGNFKFAADIQDLIPLKPGDLFGPPNELRISYGIEYDDLSTELFPVATLGISAPSTFDNGSLVDLSLRAFSRERQIQRRRWRTIYTIAAGTPVPTAIRALILNRDPDAQFGPIAPGVTATTTQIIYGATHDDTNNPLKDLNDLVESIGHEVFTDSNGKYVCLPVPDPATSPVNFKYLEGEDSTFVDITHGFDDEPGYNGVIGYAEGPDIAVPMKSEKWNDDPLSGTYYLGDWGAVPMFWSSSLITTQIALDVAVAAVYRANIGLQEQVQISTIPDPRRSVSDVFEILRESVGVNARYVGKSIEFNLDASPMKIGCRERKLVSG